jgi:hypothetical protein
MVVFIQLQAKSCIKNVKLCQDVTLVGLKLQEDIDYQQNVKFLKNLTV